MTGIIPLQNYQVVIYQKLGFSTVFSLVLTGIWGTNGCISCLCASSIVDKLGRRPLLVSHNGRFSGSVSNSVIQFVAYGFQIIGGIMLVGLWAGFEAGGSTNLGLGKAVIFGMFFFEFGYAGFMNTFFALVCPSLPLRDLLLTMQLTVSWRDLPYRCESGRCRRQLRRLQRHCHRVSTGHANCDQRHLMALFLDLRHLRRYFHHYFLLDLPRDEEQDARGD